MRLNKYLSHCGIASRRQADEMISAGRIKVNDEIVNTLGAVVDEDKDVVKVDDQEIELPTEKSYVILNKPRGYISSLVDKFGRPTVIDLIKGVDARVYPVGRLDLDTEGIILLTDDGELAYRLAHPKFEIKKLYVATIKGELPAEMISKIEAGVELDDGYVATAKAKLMSAQKYQSVVQLELHEGKKREIRRIFTALGFMVKKLRRIRFADLSCEGMRTGSWRHLNRKEVQKLRRKVGLE